LEYDDHALLEAVEKGVDLTFGVGRDIVLHLIDALHEAAAKSLELTLSTEVCWVGFYLDRSDTPLEASRVQDSTFLRQREPDDRGYQDQRLG